MFGFRASGFGDLRFRFSGFTSFDDPSMKVSGVHSAMRSERCLPCCHTYSNACCRCHFGRQSALCSG